MKNTLFIVLWFIFLLYGRAHAYGACSSYWSFAMETYDWMCKCMSWYGWSTDYSGNKICKSMTTVCSESLWYNATYSYSDDSCVCRSGYELSLDNKWYTCQSCHAKYGLNSSFNYLSNQCECNTWYTPLDGKCVEKQNNVYALLLELKTDSREAKISLDIDDDNKFDDDFYYVKYSYWCYSTDIKRYLWKLLVVNLGTDFYLDVRDKLVLPEEWYDCDVSSKKKVTNEFSIFSCEELFWDHSYEASEWQCTCDEWYEFSNSECIEKQTTTTYYYPNTTKVFSELENSVSRMFANWLTKFNKVNDYVPNWELTREQASKFFSQFSLNILGKKLSEDINTVWFKDITSADVTLQQFLTISQNLGLFKWVDGYFMPLEKLTRAQAIAVIIRAKYGYQDENYNEWFYKYYSIANNYWLIDWLSFDYSTLSSKNITRGEVAILLYRLSNLN